MKIIFLNTWNGQVKNEIEKFIIEQAGDTDIFCFQEVYDDMREISQRLLPNHKELAADKHVNTYDINKKDEFLKATYIHKDIEIISSEVITELGLGLYSQIKFKNNVVHLCNFHGLAQPGNKLDDPSRLAQSQALLDFFKDKDGLKIIGGDFNILPDQKSITMFAENGYKDLVKDFNIVTTRNRLAWEKYPGNEMYYSDYVFVSPNVEVSSFSVPNNEISDHLPMILDIKL